MGYGFSFRCKECGKTGEVFLDVGSLYPLVCSDTKERALRGELGQRAMKAVQKNPTGVFDCTRVVYKCECGFWRDDEKLLYCIPNGHDDDHSAYDEWNEENSKIVWKRRHPCSKYRKEMKRYNGDVEALKCPDCGGELEFGRFIDWD